MKVKLIYVPRLYEKHRYSYSPRHPYLPPLGIATIKSTLEKHEFHTEIDDLDVKVNKKSKSQIDLEIFDNLYSIARMLEKDKKISSKASNPSKMYEEAEKMLKLTKIKNYDLIGLSMNSEMNISTIGVALALSKVIKDRKIHK